MIRNIQLRHAGKYTCAVQTKVDSVSIATDVVVRGETDTHCTECISLSVMCISMCVCNLICKCVNQTPPGPPRSPGAPCRLPGDGGDGDHGLAVLGSRSRQPQPGAELQHPGPDALLPGLAGRVHW